MTNANRVAINTSVQYLRLVLNVVIGLYSVRIILNALGVDDYGIYDVIGGVIALLGFLRSSLSQTSLRFMSVSIGKGELKEVRRTFNDCYWLHFFIAIFLCFVIEFVGLFLFDGVLNIPSSRVDAAKWVYHCMTLNLFFNISITPFTALIVAHEKFVYTAFIGILDSVLKLGVAFLLTSIAADRLEAYGTLMTGITLINVSCHVGYLLVKYRREMNIARPRINGIKAVSGFAGWTMMDVLGVVATRQGYALVLNKFFGTATNAAFAIARQVEGHVYTISSSVIETMKPQIMKSYGAGDEDRMLRLSMTAGKMGFSMMGLVAVPLLILLPQILTIWLKNVPDNTVVFARILVLAVMAEQMTRGMVFSCQAKGDIKWISVIVSTCRFMALPITVLLFLLGFPVISAFYTFFICETIGSMSRVLITSRLLKISSSVFFREVVFRIIPPFVVTALLFTTFNRMLHSDVSALATLILSPFFFAFLMYKFGFSVSEQKIIRGVMDSFKSKIR